MGMGSDTGNKVMILMGMLIVIVIAITLIVVGGNVVGGQINTQSPVNSSDQNQSNILSTCNETNTTLDCNLFIRFGEILFITNGTTNLSALDYTVAGNGNGTLCLDNGSLNGTTWNSTYLCQIDEYDNSAIVRLLSGFAMVVMILIVIVALVVFLVLMGKGLGE